MDDTTKEALVEWINAVEKSIKAVFEITNELNNKINNVGVRLLLLEKAEMTDDETITDFIAPVTVSKGDQPNE